MLYYTTSTKPEDMQTNPSLSLGGYRSSSQIPNGEVHNLFPKITQKTITENRKVIRMIVLSNPTPTPMTNISIWSESERYSIVKLDAIAPAISSSGDLIFEKVASGGQMPYQASLEEHLASNPLAIESLAAGASVGIWIRKELDLTKFSALDKGEVPTSDQIEQMLLQQNEATEDQVKIQIQWS